MEGNHDDSDALARAETRTRGRGTVPLGFRLHHLPAGTRFTLGRLRCLAYGGAFPARPPQAGRDWYRAVARERAAFERVAGGGAVDLLFCHDPRTLEQGAQARGSFAALAAKLRPALVFYAHQHRPYVSAGGQPALVGLGSSRTACPRRLCLTAPRRAGSSAHSATGSPLPTLKPQDPHAITPARLDRGGTGLAPAVSLGDQTADSFAAAVPSEAVYGVEFPFGTETSVIKVGGRNEPTARITAWSAHRPIADPVARARPEAGSTVAGVGELTAVEREAAAADAFGEPEFQALELGDALVDPRAPGGGEA